MKKSKDKKFEFKIALSDKGIDIIAGTKPGMLYGISCIIACLISNEEANITEKDINFAVKSAFDSVNIGGKKDGR